MNTLVTGATGFVGSWMTKYLVQSGHKVRVLARPSSDFSELNGIDYEKCFGNVTDLSSLENALSGIDHVFHLAGLVGYSKAMRNPMEEVNVKGTQNLLEACKKNGKIKRFLHFSSVVAVGASFDGKNILNEDSPYSLSPLNLGYFETKHRAEALVIEAVQKNEIDAVVVNPSTIYGPGDAKKGSRKVQLKVARGAFPFYTSGGVNVISIRDVTEAAHRAWEVGRTGERYILAGDNIRIKELFEMIAEAAGVPPPHIYLPNPLVKTIGRIGDVLETFGKKGPLNSENAWASLLFHWFDASKAKKELGLNPTPAKTAIQESVQWIKENGLLEQ